MKKFLISIIISALSLPIATCINILIAVSINNNMFWLRESFVSAYIPYAGDKVTIISLVISFNVISLVFALNSLTSNNHG